MNLQDHRWVGYLLLLIAILVTWIGSMSLYLWNEWMIFAMIPMVFLFIFVSVIIGNYWDIEVDTSTDNSSCDFCGISKSFLGRNVKWAYRELGVRCDVFHCVECHIGGRCPE